ncbi:glycosyltransferase family 4 protein [Streptomyces ficellus]|uniref:Glycosyltransferase family 4 protein n=2 Tax=Streptomyces ficellus TaxID=1977088 RepID=A0ABT7ZA48_9ACTN|nr:glycosyltransferase family 4 protein [Streptomyces ficellus]MDN3296391.1 glycosyltransferase family 4 protein [Streptomyces ficellus]
MQAPAVTSGTRSSQDAAPPPRRIVFLSRRDLGNRAAGGSELLVDRLAEGLTALGHEVTLLCGGPAAYRDYRVVSAGGDLGHFLRAPSAFTRQVGDCDLLVEVCNGLPYLAPLWHRGPTLCLVNHVHTELWGMRYPRPAAGIGRRLERWALSGAQRDNLLVAVSESTASALDALGVDPARIRVVHNGVEDPGRRTPRSAQPLFLAVGRLVEYKRIDLLLRLWERVRPVTGGELVIVGDGPERRRLEALAGPGVVFAGRVSDEEKHRLLCASWLLLHPSAVEGWGLVITEAATRGTPSIGFDVPGLRDSVDDGVTGALVRGESAFAAAWCALALGHERRAAMGRAAALRAERYRWATTVRRFRAVAVEAAARHRATGCDGVATARATAAGLSGGSPAPGGLPVAQAAAPTAPRRG